MAALPYDAPTGTGVAVNRLLAQLRVAVAGGAETTAEDFIVTNSGGPFNIQPVAFPDTTPVEVPIPANAAGVIITSPSGNTQQIYLRDSGATGGGFPLNKTLPCPLTFERSAVSGESLWFTAASAVSGNVRFAWF
jgi:hypothetical protein